MSDLLVTIQNVVIMIIALDVLIFAMAFMTGNKELQKKLIEFHRMIFAKVLGNKKGKSSKRGTASRSGYRKKGGSSMEEKRTFGHQFAPARVEEINDVMSEVREGALTFKGAKNKLGIGSYQMWYLLACDVNEYSPMNADLYRLDAGEIKEIENVIGSVEEGEVTYYGALDKLDIEIQQLMIFVGMFSRDTKLTSYDKKPAKKANKKNNKKKDPKKDTKKGNQNISNGTI